MDTTNETRAREAGKRLEAGAAMTPTDDERGRAVTVDEWRFAMLLFGVFSAGALMAVFLVGCSSPTTPGAGAGGSSSGFAATDSSGSPSGSGQVDPPIRQDSTGEPSTSSSSSSSDGGTTGSESSTGSETGALCERFPVDSKDRTYVVCMCDGIVSDPELCPLCKPGTCEPTECWDGDPGCYCHGWIADPMFCEGGSTGESGSSTG